MARRLPFVPLVGNGKQSINPVFVRDVARVIADCLDDPRTDNQTLEIGGPDGPFGPEAADALAGHG